MLALKVYRMLKEVDRVDGILKEAAWEYDTACNNDCGSMITQDFFDSMNAAQDALCELLNPMYENAKMRRIAEILDEDIKELFEEWDMMTDDFPFE